MLFLKPYDIPTYAKKRPVVALFEKGNGIYRAETKTRRGAKQEAL